MGTYIFAWYTWNQSTKTCIHQSRFMKLIGQKTVIINQWAEYLRKCWSIFFTVFPLFFSHQHNSALFSRYSVYPFSILSRCGIKHPKPIPFYGNLFMFRQVRYCSNRCEKNLPSVILLHLLLTVRFVHWRTLKSSNIWCTTVCNPQIDKCMIVFFFSLISAFNANHQDYSALCWRVLAELHFHLVMIDIDGCLRKH